MTSFRILPALFLLLIGCSPTEPRVELSAEDGESPATQSTTGRSGQDRDPEVSLDGRMLFYASSAFGPAFELFVKKIGSNAATRVTTLSGAKRFPRLNPVDPRILAFCTDARGEWEIAIINHQEHPERVEYISQPGTHNLHPSWSPNGRYLVYCSSEDLSSGEWTLKIRDFATGRTISFEDIDGLLPEWSPRDNRIVFQRMRRRDNWYSSLWTLEFEEGTAKNLSVLLSSEDWAAINPSWAPDAKHIAFATVAKSRQRSGVLDQGDDIWCVRADGSHPTRLTTAPAADWMPRWSVDDRIYFISNRDGTDRIWSLRPDLPDQK